MRSNYREKAIEQFGERCTFCGETEDVQIHHIDGDRTNDDLSNLLPVCLQCHWDIHNGENEEWSKKLLSETELSHDRTLFNITCPDDLWDAWKETVPRRLNLNDGLLKLIAHATQEQRGDELDDATRQRINEILNR